MSRVFANGPGDRSSIPGRVLPKTQKMVLDSYTSVLKLLKESLQVTLDCSRQLTYFFIIVP